MTPILLALAYTAMDQGEWWVGVGVALLAIATALHHPKPRSAATAARSR